MSSKHTISPEVVAAHGLSEDEFDRAVALIGRTPSITELGIFSAMWNEHPQRGPASFRARVRMRAWLISTTARW